MAEESRTAKQPELEEQSLCLAFANTMDWHASDRPKETLHTYHDLVSWAQRFGILADTEARHLLREARRRPADGAAVLAKAVALREAIYRMFSAVAEGCAAAQKDVAALNVDLCGALAKRRIVSSKSGFAWGWAGTKDELDRMLWPVVWSAAALLTSEDLGRVGRCADDRGCGWLFLDRSRNRSRRWCEMKDCGNRAKAKRHYRRVRQSRMNLHPETR